MSLKNTFTFFNIQGFVYVTLGKHTWGHPRIYDGGYNSSSQW